MMLIRQEKSGETTQSVGQYRHDVIRVPVNRIADIWNEVFPLLAKSRSANPELEINQIIEGLCDESIQLWLIMPHEGETEIVALFLTSIERDKGEWVLSLYNLGGRDPQKWVMDCHRAMHMFASLEDCRRVRLCGRPAWQRILPGYQVVGERGGHLIYERAVD